MNQHLFSLHKYPWLLDPPKKKHRYCPIACILSHFSSIFLLQNSEGRHWLHNNRSAFFAKFVTPRYEIGSEIYLGHGAWNLRSGSDEIPIQWLRQTRITKDSLWAPMETVQLWMARSTKIDVFISWRYWLDWHTAYADQTKICPSAQRKRKTRWNRRKGISEKEQQLAKWFCFTFIQHFLFNSIRVEHSRPRYGSSQIVKLLTEDLFFSIMRKYTSFWCLTANQQPRDSLASIPDLDLEHYFSTNEQFDLIRCQK